jgi:CheY-like chemotaxis protein/HPt (histidine-containing phosphotransfer) domain-containing protein
MRNGPQIPRSATTSRCLAVREHEYVEMGRALVATSLYYPACTSELGLGKLCMRVNASVCSRPCGTWRISPVLPHRIHSPEGWQCSPPVCRKTHTLHDWPKMEIIIVDDEPVSLTLLKQLVRKLPHCQAVGFTDPSAALAWCQPNDPDLVIVDYMMPHVDGIEFARRLCALEGRSDTPLLMVSATADRTIRNSALQQGVSGFMNKPFSFVELQTRVADMITMRSKQIKAASQAVLVARDLPSAGFNESPNNNQLLKSDSTLARLDGDATLFAAIASVFVRTVPQLIASISMALSTNCFDRAYSDAHSLKGAVSAFEAPEVLKAVALLEQHAKSYNATAATAAFYVVETLCERLLDELTSMAASTAPK